MSGRAAFVDLALVAVGGGLGSALRYLAALAMAPWSAAWPIDYLVVNGVGSLAIGVVLALTVELGRLSERARLFAAIGVLGGFTTFSTYASGVYALLAHGAWGLGAWYALASLVIGLVAAYAGLVGTRLAYRAAAAGIAAR